MARTRRKVLGEYVTYSEHHARKARVNRRKRRRINTGIDPDVIQPSFSLSRLRREIRAAESWAVLPPS